MGWYGDSEGHRKVGRIGGKSQGKHSNPGNFAHNIEKARRAGRIGGTSKGAKNKLNLPRIKLSEEEIKKRKMENAKRWVKNNPERRREIARNSARRRKLLIAILFGIFSFHSVYAISPLDIQTQTNEQRELNNLSDLKVNKCLVLAAQTKLNDMVSKHYFAHKTLNGDNISTFTDFAKYKGYWVGENLALGYSTDQEITTAWMNSPSHKKNVLDNSFTEIGVATGTMNWEGKDQVLTVAVFGAPRKGIKSCK